MLLIVGWAFVGAASYLLISFWYRRDTATDAGIKAFVMNVIGDVGLVIGAFLLLNETGALDYVGVFERAPEVFASERRRRSWPPACCCWWARSPSRRSCRCTPGCRTRWRAPRRCPR